MDGGDFGRYGVLRFMRRHEETVIASYPIDDEELTFGCDPSCSVRLYYPTVSPLHAKIIFQERKAFIEVLGVHGLLVDKCPVFPASTTHTTVPLTNNSELEISKKRFRFEYPPKALRPALAFTPAHATRSARKRVLRLSMIQSAQVFSPRPDPDPHVNLRVLQTPIRLNSSPLKHVHRTPGQTQSSQLEEEEYGTPFRLVEGTCPQVVQEEQDLVILEEVDAPEHLPQATPHGMNGGVAQSGFNNPMQSPAHVPQTGGPYPAPAFPIPPSHQIQQFQTPRRRPGRPSLHRAVLIRSAQRAAMRVEMEQEQEQEEREVEEHVVPVEERIDECEEEQGDRDAVIEEFDEDAHEDDDGENLVPDPEPAAPAFGWHKGFEAFKSGLQALRSRSRSPEKNEHKERDVDEECTSSNEEEVHRSSHDDGALLGQNWGLQEPKEEEDLGTVPLGDEARLESDIGARVVSMSRQFTPQRPARPFSFMTPQVSKANGDLSLADRVRGRKSTGGFGQTLARPWQVTDLAVPDIFPSTPGVKVEPGQQAVSDSERQAIQERRRSALAQPDMFFGGNIPGSGSRRNSLGSGTPGAKGTLIFTSPAKTCAAIKEDDEEAETTSLLEKMKEVVEGMQRRRSMQPEAITNVAISNTSEEDDEDEGQQDEILEDHEATADEPVPLQTDFRSTAQPFPATPHMSDLKHVFSEKRAANIPSSYAGVRDLFKAEPSMGPETPRLDGVREMFFRARDQEPRTPIFEGVGEMLATPAGYFVQDTTRSNEVGMKSTAEAPAPAPSAKHPRRKPTVADLPPRPESRIGRKMPGLRAMHDGRTTPADTDDESTPDDPPAKHSKPQKGSNVRRTRTESEAKQDATIAPTKPTTKARKVITPEVTDHAPLQPNPVVPEPGPTRRSRATTKSAGSTATESEAAESNKSMRKTVRGRKAATTPAANAEPDDLKPDLEAETTKGTRRRGRTRSQSVEVAAAPAPAPAPTTTKRRVGAKSKKTATQGAPVEDGPPRSAADRAESPEAPPAAARARRGKAKPAAETDDESTGTAGAGALRVARGRRPPTGTGAASNRAPAGKGRAVVIPSSRQGAARAAAGEKENTPERIHVKEEEDDKVGLPPVATKGARARGKGGAGVAPKALSEPEKDTTAPPKTRGPRTRAASGRK